MSIEIQQIQSYDDNDLGLLLAQYVNADNFQNLLRAFNGQMDKLESAMFEVRDLYWLDTATGIQLDVIGDVLNVTREGLNDTDYSQKIKEFLTLNSSGTPEQIINIVKLVFGFTSPVFYGVEYPAGYHIYDEDGMGVDSTELDKFSPAGVLGFFSSPIAQGDLTESEPWLVDAYGEEIVCAQQVDFVSFTTEDGDSIITEDGDTLGGTELLGA